MPCEQEEAAVERARESVGGGPNCDGLAIQYGPNDPRVLSCRAMERARQGRLQAAQEALRECREGARILDVSGRVTFLRVHELGSGFGGGQSNLLEAEVVFRLDSAPNQGFGFQLRDDEFLPARQGMLALLRDAMVHDLTVTADYNELVTPPNQNSFVIRVAITKPSEGAVGPVTPEVKL
jgi:hypothetical protein